MEKREKIPDDIRAKVVADLVAGVKPAEIKEKYDVSLPSISRIKQNLTPEILEKMDEVRRNTLGDLVLTHLETSLESAINVMNMTRDEQWMRAQTARDLNMFYGTMTDKAIRMAESIEFAQKGIEQDEQQRNSDFGNGAVDIN